MGFYQTLCDAVLCLVCLVVGTRPYCESETDESFVYVNWHETPEVGGTFESLLEPSNGVGGDIQHEEYLAGLQSLLSATNAASSSKLGAYGSKWSFNDGPFNDKILIQSWGLNYAKIGVGSEHLEDGIDGSKLVFVQSGVMVRHLNAYLEANNLALITSGFGDGNRLVGAVQTGTHNSQPEFGSMQDYVKGIHLVLPNRHIYLQGDAVFKESYAATVLQGASLLTDEDLFNAAVVGGGSFGIIHGMVIQAADLYYLDTRLMEVTLQQLLASNVLTTLYARDLGFENFEATEQPYDLTIAINPFEDAQEATAFVRTAKQVSSRNSAVPELGRYQVKPLALLLSDAVMDAWDNAQRDNITVSSLNTIMRENAGSAPNWFIQHVYSVVLPAVIRQEFGYPAPPTVYTPGELYSSDGIAPFGFADLPSVSAEIGVRLEDLEQVLTILIDALNGNPLPTPLTIRYVRASDAFLSLAKFDNITAAIDFTSLWDDTFFPETGNRLRTVLDKVREAGIEHTCHLGKFQPLGNSWINGYGPEEVATWQAQRKKLLNDGSTNLCNTFTNDWLAEIGLEDGCQ